MGVRLQAFVVVTAVLGGCGIFFEPKPDLENQKSMTVAGLELRYPGNWKTEVESEEVQGYTFTTLSIESSGSALAMVQVFEPGIEFSAQQVFDSYMEGMDEASDTEFGGMVGVKKRKTEDFSRELFGESLQGRAAVLDFSVLGETVPHRIQSLHRNGEDATVVIVVQAPVEDWSTIAPGFDAIYDSIADAP